MRRYKLLIILISTFYISTYANLPIPPLLEGSNLELIMQNGQLELPFGTSKTMGFNGNYLGPTIRVSKNDYIKLNIKNQLGEDSTVHWHGLHVRAEFDGGPHQIIKKNETWRPEFKINQNAATLWYHPHLMGKTAEHVYNGLAGMFYIEDEISKSLNIPNKYGINDIPLILQDRRVTRKGEFYYNPGMHDVLQGYIGNVMLVNGAMEPTLDISKGTYRFRILNGSNSSIFRLRFSNKKEFTVIASDGGFLPKSSKETSLVISPGERFEIMVDFKESDEISLFTDIYGGDSFKSLTIKVNSDTGLFYEHPKTYDYSPVTFNPKTDISREFKMETRGMKSFTINGKKMSLSRVDFSLNKNTTEIWDITNVSKIFMMNVPHSFHVHDVQFSVISINGAPPGPLYSGPKDTVLIMPGDNIRIALNFKEYTGIYMYHCHFLEHEDNGMMGQFNIK